MYVLVRLIIARESEMMEAAKGEADTVDQSD